MKLEKIAIIINIKYFSLFLDDIPIVAKEDVGTDKANLVSISEEQDTTEPSRVGSLRQGKDTKGSSKITNFSLTKKPREKDGKPKNGYVEKEKKLGQKDFKTRGLDGEEANGSVKKKNDSIISDGNSSYTDVGLSNDLADLELENSVNMRVHDPDGSSVQVSSV